MDHSTPQPLASKEDAEHVIRALLREAIDLADREILPRHRRNWQTYHGRVNVVPDAGGASMVSQLAKNIIKTMIPDIINILVGTETVCEYVPPNSDPATAKLCDDATRGAMALFWANGGYPALHDALIDAGVSGTSGGWFRVGTKTKRKLEKSKPSIWTENEHIAAVHASQSDPSMKIIQHDDGQTSLSKITQEDMISIEAVPASDMIWIAAASADDTYLIGRRCDVRLGDMVQMGFKPEQLKNVGMEDKTKTKGARRARDQINTDDRNRSIGSGSWSLRPVTFFEVYARIDIDGDGIPELYQVYLGGKSREILHIQEVDYQPFVQVPFQRIPHGMFCEGLVDEAESGQDASTLLLWAMLDNASTQSSPLIMAPDTAVDHDALAVWKKWKVVRNDAPGSAQFFAPSDSSASILAAKQSVDSEIEDRLGISKAALNLDPNALSSTPEVGILGALSAAQRKIMFYARTIAEFGFKPVFAKLLYIMMKNPDLVRAAKLPNLENFDPSGYSQDWQIRTKVGLGSADAVSHERIYMQIWNVATQMASAPGPIARACPPDKAMTMVRDWLKARPDINPDRYFATAEEMRKIMAEADQAPPPPDPKMDAAKLAAQTQIQIANQKIQSTEKISTQELIEKKRQHDTNLGVESVFAAQNIALKAAEMAQHGEQHTDKLVASAAAASQKFTNGIIAERGN